MNKKEILIEEKARRYDEALTKARNIVNSINVGLIGKDSFEAVFPELKESEDERIRKAIHIYLDWLDDIKEYAPKGEYTIKDMIAWLEKQGNLMKALQISNAEIGELIEKNYYLKEQLEKQGEKKSIDDLTQQEAMDIAVDKCFEQGEQKPAETVKWSPQEESCICQLESLVKERWRQADKVHNSVIIKKMSELMFFLKTLNPNKKPQRIISSEVKEAMYDKPAGSEEDEKIYNNLTEFESSLKHIMEEAIECGDTHNLKADADLLLRLVQTPAWSEEDNRMCKAIIDNIQAICEEGYFVDNIDSDELINWLNSLKDRVQPQPKQEWSEEDECCRNQLIIFCENCMVQDSNAKKCANWLKSLRPQTAWKPSESDIRILEQVIDGTANPINYHATLHAILEKLKKLRKE